MNYTPTDDIMIKNFYGDGMGKKIICISAVLTLILCSCAGKLETETLSAPSDTSTSAVTETAEEKTTEKDEVPVTVIRPDETLKMLEKDFFVSSYSGDYGFDEFLERGGAKSDRELTDFLIEYVATQQIDLMLQYMGSGCSTLAASDKDGNEYFGRNYDWNFCEGIIMLSEPENGYRSVSTVDGSYVTNPNFEIEGDIKRFCALYCPLDGMNEKGVCICVNMISDNSTADQNTDKPDITTTTAIRLVLDKAATTDEAVNLLKEYDMHFSKGQMIHFAVSDASGKTVAIEYVNGEMCVTETNVMTNFYLTEGEKYGIGSNQSHARYDILSDLLKEKEYIGQNGMRDALSSVSKKNFGEFMSTEWSAVFDKTNLTVTYYHRENYEKGYRIEL